MIWVERRAKRAKRYLGGLGGGCRMEGLERLLGTSGMGSESALGVSAALEEVLHGGRRVIISFKYPCS